MKKYFIPIIISLCLIAYIIGFSTTTTTTNLLLVKPDAEDTTTDWFNTMNDNMDLVDAVFDTVTLTEFAYLDGVTSAIQTQLDSKTDINTTYTAGDFITLTGTDFDVDVKDEDDMTSDSATYLATQQSIKKYVDDNAGTLTEEEVEDYAGGMFTGNTETLIAMTYQEADGTVDAVVDSDLHKYSWTNVVDADITDTLTSSACTGNSATVTTNANLTGDVTSTGNATDITESVLAVGGTDTIFPADPDADKYLMWDDDPGEFVFADAAGGGGYTNLTSFVDQTAWRVFYSNTAGDVTELALGDDGQYLMSNGAAVAPTFETPGGGGDMLKATYDADADDEVDVAGGGTEKASWTQYCIPYLSDTTVFGEIPIGTAEYALTVAAGATGYDWTELAFAAKGANADITSLTGLTTALAANYGGTGVANGAGETITMVGDDAITFTTTAATSVTLPTAGTLMAEVVQDTTPTLGGNLTGADKDITGLGSVGFTQELDNGSKTENFSVDFVTDQKQKCTLTANTMTLTLDTTTVGVGNYLLKIVNGGLATLTWAGESGSIYFPGGTDPDLTSSGTDIVTFYFDGTNFYGMAGLDFK